MTIDGVTRTTQLERTHTWTDTIEGQTSLISKSIQKDSNLEGLFKPNSEKVIQTLIDKLEQSIQTISDPSLIIHDHIPLIGKFSDPIFMTEMINPYNHIDRYMTRSEMLINFSSV